MPKFLLVAIVVAVSAGAGCSPEARKARFMAAGKAHLAKNDYARALIDFQNAIKAQPLDPEPYYQLGLAHLAAGNSPLALEAMKRAVELNPKHQQAQLRLSELLSASTRKGVLEEAETRARAVLLASPGNVDALNTLAVTQWKLGKKEDAERHLQQAFDNAPQNWNVAISLAKIKLARKDVSGAEALLRQAAEQKPPSANSVLALAEFYASTGKPADAERELGRALQIDPRNTTALIDLAALYVRGGRGREADETYRKIAALPDKRYRPVHAIFLLQSGKDAAGLAELESLAKADPSNREVFTLRVETYISSGRVADAKKLITATLAANPRDIDALFQMGRVHVAAGEYAKALHCLTEVIGVRPDLAEAHYLIATAQRQLGARSSHKAELEEALRLKPDLLAARLDLARYLIEAQAYQGALDLINRAPESQRDLLPVITQKNWALLGVGTWVELRQGIDRGLSIRRTPELLVQDAMLRLERREFAPARNSILEALKSEPENLRALNLLAYGYTLQGQPSAGLDKVRQHAAQHPKSALVQQFLGEVLETNGHLDDARQAFLAAKAANPKLFTAALSVAQLDVQAGRLESARETLSGVLSADPGNSRARFVLGTIESAKRNYSAAIQQYRKVLEAEPSNVPALNNLAVALTNQGDNLTEAVEVAEKAKELAPYNADVEDTLGWALYRKGLYSLAVRHLERAVSLKASARHQVHLSMAYAKAGDGQRGRAVLALALKQDPAVPEISEAQQVLGTTKQ